MTILDELLTTLPLITDRQKRTGVSPAQRRVDTGTLLKIIAMLIPYYVASKTKVEPQEKTS